MLEKMNLTLQKWFKYKSNILNFTLLSEVKELYSSK